MDGTSNPIAAVRPASGAAHGKAAHGGAAHGGAVHGGAVHGGAVHGGAVHGGAVHGGAVHGGAVHGGAVHGGAAHSGAVHGGAVHGGAVHGGAAHGGAVHGGAVHGGAAHGGAAHGGAVPGSAAQDISASSRRERDPAAVRPVVPVELRLMAAGYCVHPEFVTIRGGSLKSAAYPAGFALIRHPSRGWILFDTGYSARFEALTQHLPYALYRRLTPVRFREEDAAVRQLARLGVRAEDVALVILSHFHADHIGGARDFPHARFLYPEAAYAPLRRLGPVRATRAGFIASLLPDGFADTASPIERTATWMPPGDGSPMSGGWDLLGDGSLIAVSLPGHAAGQIGLLLTATGAADNARVVMPASPAAVPPGPATPPAGSTRYLLCADASWSSRALRENRPPHPAAGLVMDDRAAYRDSFALLRRWQASDPALVIVPSHCREFFAIKEDGPR
ncbi:MBL fold metallo-hydrolase [Cohnella sp. 56]|uniref:MBL fold metallo-hydrolase n=1 Tax=Cohnella sp. 56 TaxID=3113722 RepID=UPI0030E794B9